MKNESDTHKLIIYSLLFFAICIIIYLCIPDYSIWANKWMNYDDKGQIGDVIGGTTSPIIAIIAAYLTFLAFWIQYRANKQQRQDIAIERFESRFYEMLHLHRENLSDLDCGKAQGREAVSFYCYKLFILYTLVEFIINQMDEAHKKMFKEICNKDYGEIIEEKTTIAYNLFLYGANYSSIFNFRDDRKKMYDIISREIEAFESAHTSIKEDAAYTEELIRINFVDNIDYYSKSIADEEYELLSDAPDKLLIPDKLLCGYNAKLGVYYRQLYHMAKFIILKDGLNESDRYEYMRVVRCQLSDYEQILLYYNSLAHIGSKWNESLNSPNDVPNEKWHTSMGLISRFRLIKNIPSSFIMFGYTPERKYLKDILNYKKYAPDVSFFESRKVDFVGE